VGLLYQDLIRASKSRDLATLPAILPIVLHRGCESWSAAEEVSSLLSDAPPGLEQYRPQLRYLLIDECRYDDAELAADRNFAAMLFRIEKCRRRDLMWRLVSTLLEWLGDPELMDLRRAFVVWLRRVVLKHPYDDAIANNLWERPAMLSEQVEIWE